MATETNPPPPPPPETGGAGVHKLEAQRRENRAAAAALGSLPYGERRDGIVTLEQARRMHDPAADAELAAAGKEPPAGFVDRRPTVRVTGRVMLSRDNGKLIWFNLRDHTGDLQIAVSAKDADEKSFALAKLVDLGDVVTAHGRVMKTRHGEVTIWVDAGQSRAGGVGGLEIASKCLMPPPEKHAGLAAPELRYRRRYVDMWATPETTRVFAMRSRIVSRIRRELDEQGYMEVETPMLQALAGGAAARPFRTHMNALTMDLFLRIAPELYLKRLLVGGLPRVYEINRNFRNEGLDKQHNPEFTMLEVYHAFSDARGMMDLTEGLIRSCAAMVAAEGVDASGTPGDEDAAPERQTSLVLPFGDLQIDYGKPFARVPYPELFKKALGFEMTDTKRVRAEVLSRNLAKHIKGAAVGKDTPAEKVVESVAPVLLVNTLFEEFAEKSVDASVPTFITDYPSAISPLTRPRPDNPLLADRADLFIAHMELAPMYTELNDPDVQEAKFREQLAGVDEEESTFRTFDQDFIDALKVGMPPAGGMGLGIDRLVMLLTNQRTIRDVVLFPLMRPQG